MSEIEGTIRRIVDKKANLLVSAVSFAEVLDKTGTSDAGTQFRGFVKRQNVVIANLDARIAMLAGDIRTAALQAHADDQLSQGIKIPDLLITATAITYRADELQTFDPVLLEVSGWDIVAGMPILRPDDANRSPLGF